MSPLSVLDNMADSFSPVRIVCWCLVLVAWIGAGAWGGYALATHHYEPKLTAANKTIGELEAVKTALTMAVKRQNAAIDNLQTMSEARKKQADQAVKQARMQAQKKQTQAQAVLLKKPPDGDPCAAAQAEFDKELQAERAGR